MILPDHVVIEPTLPTDAFKLPAIGRSASENCARIKDLGFTTSKHITMYGEHFELVSDPFIEGDYTAVHAITQNNPGIRTLRLPVATLIGLAERFRRPAPVIGQESL